MTASLPACLEDSLNDYLSNKTEPITRILWTDDVEKEEGESESSSWAMKGDPFLVLFFVIEE